MKRRTAVVAVAALAGCAPGQHHDLAATSALPRVPLVGPDPRPIELEAQGEPSASVRDLGIFRATCYAEHGTTASGAPSRAGSIAVDPNVIPLGTRLHVAGWGNGTADDTGGAIHGRRVDVWLTSNAACIAWGVRWVDVVEEAA